MKAYTIILMDILCNLLRYNATERSGNYTQTNNHRCAGLAVAQCHGCSLKLLQRMIHFFPKITAFFCQTNISSGFFKKLDSAQLRFQMMDGAA